MTEYQTNIAARQAYYDSLNLAHRDVISTLHIDYTTNMAGEFVLSTTEAAFLAWQAQGQDEFTQADHAALHSLRSRGFAIVIFTPSELEDLDDHGSIDALESRMITVGNEYISDHEKE